MSVYLRVIFGAILGSNLVWAGDSVSDLAKNSIPAQKRASAPERFQTSIAGWELPSKAETLESKIQTPILMTTPPGTPGAPDIKALSYDWTPNESGEPIICSHGFDGTPYDFWVLCGKSRFRSHISVEPIRLAKGVFLEILHYVTEYGPKGEPIFHSNSMRMFLTPGAELKALDLSTGIEGDTASLVVTVQIPSN